MLTIIAIAIIILDIVGIVRLCKIFDNIYLPPLGVIILLIIVGKLGGGDAVACALLIGAAIFLIVMLVKKICSTIYVKKKWVEEIKRDRETRQRNDDFLNAVNRGDRYSARKLLWAGADVNCVGYINARKSTALQLAVENNDKEMVTFLVEQGANVNFIVDARRFALQLAVENNDKEMVALLIENGADVNLLNEYHHSTPLDFAKDDEIKEFLRNHGAKTQAEIAEEEKSRKEAEEERSRAAIKEYMRQQELSEKLIIASAKHEIGIAEFLISQGADVNYCKPLEGTPLLMAITSNDIEMIRLLLKHGADPRKEYRLFGSDISAISYARYGLHKDNLADFLEYF